MLHPTFLPLKSISSLAFWTHYDVIRKKWDGIWNFSSMKMLFSCFLLTELWPLIREKWNEKFLVTRNRHHKSSNLYFFIFHSLKKYRAPWCARMKSCWLGSQCSITSSAAYIPPSRPRLHTLSPSHYLELLRGKNLKITHTEVWVITSWIHNPSHKHWSQNG